MPDNVYKFRCVKWGDPNKLKVLVEDLSPRKRPLAFVLTICLVSAAAFAVGYLF